MYMGTIPDVFFHRYGITTNASALAPGSCVEWSEQGAALDSRCTIYDERLDDGREVRSATICSEETGQP